MCKSKNPKKNILISVSGGKSSAFMAIYLKHLYSKENLLFIFANTGKEKEETLKFLKLTSINYDLNIIWVEAKVTHKKGIATTYKLVNYRKASRKGEPFTEVIKKYGLPSKLYRHCTRELKERPIHKFAKDYFNSSYLTAIGIRADEKHRLSKKKNYIYPLADVNIDLQFINNWWSNQKFNLQLQPYEGNCDLCFLKSKKKKIQIITDGLNVSWWLQMELEYSKVYQAKFDVRNNLSILQLVELSRLKNLQLNLYDDISFNCYCSN